MFDYLIFIGRFQPFHLGHAAVIKQALSQSKQVIVLLGSANSARTLRNPFSIEERQSMIISAFSKDDAARIICVPLEDCIYNDTRWVNGVQNAVAQVAGSRESAKQLNIGLIGHSKDQSSYYLSLFPTWQSINVANYKNLSATTIRDAYLLAQNFDLDALPLSVQAFLDKFKHNTAYQQLHAEALFIQKYRQQWANAPYAPTFVTTDAVVVQSGHILLVERKAMPGAGMLALPGGFLDQHETMLDGCIRELREETRLKVPEPVLRGSLKKQKTYDDPYRSARGRTVTQAFYFALRNDPQGLPKVKGGDDARHAFWLPLGNIKPEHMFEDHYAIISDLTGI